MIIEFSNVAKQYSTSRIFANLTFEHKVSYLCGDNGSGKSTLLRILADIEQADSGAITFDGQPRGGLQVALSSESIQVPDMFTGYELLHLHKHNRGLNEALFLECAKQLGLHPFLSTRISKLSTGNNKKLSVLLTLCSKADIYALDEPFNGVDASSLPILKEMILENKKVLIVVDHNKYLGSEIPETVITLAAA